MNNLLLFKRVFLLGLLLVGISSNAQIDDTTSFRFYHQSAAQMEYFDETNFVFQQGVHDVDSLIRILFRKGDWTVEELNAADSLLSWSEQKGSPVQQGAISYNVAYAYRDFDGAVCDSLLRKAYSIFVDLEDLEGQIFSLTSLLENHFIGRDEKGNDLEGYIIDTYKTLFRLKEQTTYQYAKERILGNQFNYQLLLGKPLGEEFLDSVYIVLKNESRQPTPYTANILAEISIHYFNNQIKDKALRVAKEALDMTYTFSDKQGDKEQPVYLYNLGYLYADNQQFDSALYYLHAARVLLPNLENAYYVRLKSNVLFGLAQAHYRLKQVDSAYQYMEESLQLTVKAADLTLQEKRVYADKKHEATYYKMQLDQSRIAAQKQRVLQLIYLAIAVFVGFFGLVTLWLYQKRKKLIVEAQKLSSNREQLLQVISHDLSSNIRSLITYVKIYNDAKDHLEPKELKALEFSFIDSGTAMQNTLQNINYWGASFRKERKVDKEVVQVDALIAEILAAYKLSADLRELTLFAECDSYSLRVDPSAIAVLCRNLINNAIKHALPKTAIHVHCKRAKDEVRMTISNTCLPEDKTVLQEILNKMAHQENYTSQDGSLGMELISKALRKIGGSMEMAGGNDAPDAVAVLIRIPAV